MSEAGAALDWPVMLVVAVQVVLAEETENEVKGMEQRLAVLEEETAALRRRRATLNLTLEVSGAGLVAGLHS